MDTPSRHRAALPGLLLMLLLWEVAGQAQWVGQGALPAPSGILRQWWLDRGDYPPHIWGTLKTAFAGFVIGNTVAVLMGMWFAW